MVAAREVLKAYQENSSPASFAKVLDNPDSPSEKADETALFQGINQLNRLSLWMRATMPGRN